MCSPHPCLPASNPRGQFVTCCTLPLPTHQGSLLCLAAPVSPHPLTPNLLPLCPCHALPQELCCSDLTTLLNTGIFSRDVLLTDGSPTMPDMHMECVLQVRQCLHAGEVGSCTNPVCWGKFLLPSGLAPLLLPPASNLTKTPTLK